MHAHACSRAREKLCESAHVGIGGCDASILATMDARGINSIMTHDQAFRRVPNVRVIDPSSSHGPTDPEPPTHLFPMILDHHATISWRTCYHRGDVVLV